MEKRSPIYLMIKKEYDRLSKEIENYQKKIAKLPEGTIKVINSKYCYRSFRDGSGKSKTKYAGTIENIQDIYDEINLRKSYESILDGLKDDLLEMEEYLKAGDRYYKRKEKNKGK